MFSFLIFKTLTTWIAAIVLTIFSVTIALPGIWGFIYFPGRAMGIPYAVAPQWEQFEGKYGRPKEQGYSVIVAASRQKTVEAVTRAGYTCESKDSWDYCSLLEIKPLSWPNYWVIIVEWDNSARFYTERSSHL